MSKVQPDPTRPPASLTALADWIEDRLADELASRQHIAETALAGIRELTSGSAPVSAATIADARKADAAVAAFIAAGPDGTTEWTYRRGDVAMEAAHALHALLIVLGTAAPALSRDDLAIVAGALDHAGQLMRERAAAGCEACTTAAAGACDVCLDQLDQADVYAALAERIGGTR